MLKKSQGLVARLAKARCLGWCAARQIWSGASNKPPTLEPDPILEIDRRHDPEENIETTPPDDECVDLRGVWGIEFYTPAHVESLVEGFRKLGWDKGGRLGNPENLVGWLRDSRQHFYGGAWLNLYDYPAPLPKGVESTSIVCYSITPSLTCIVTRFDFAPCLRSRFDEALRSYRKTYRRPVKGGTQICGPRVQKSDDVFRIRNDISNLAARWYRENLPGVFSSDLLEDKMPICELIMLRKAEPFPESRDSEEFGSRGYLRILDLDYSPYAWRSIGKLGMKFSTRIIETISTARWEWDRQNYSVLAARKHDCDGNGKINGTDNLAASALVSRWAILPLLEAYGRHLNNIRDSITTRFGHQEGRETIEDLRALVQNADASMDIASLTTDLSSSIKDPTLFCSEILHLGPIEERIKWKSMAEFICLVIGEYTTKLCDMDQALRDITSQYGSLWAATESTRMQDLVIRMTWWIIALAIVSLVISMVSLTFSIGIGESISVFLNWLGSHELNW